MTTPETTVVIVNIGTPDAPNVGAVRRYLGEFLMDARIIPLPRLLRWLLVKLFITPLRAPKSLAAYRAIWTPAGSPLKVYGEQLRAALQDALGPQVSVRNGMCYGTPGLAQVLADLRSPHIILCPLFPQYAAVTVGGVRAVAYQALSQLWDAPRISIVPPFFARPEFVRLLAQQVVASQPWDHLLFSFHGLPQSHLVQSQCSAHRDQACTLQSCSPRSADLSTCYRAQCFATAQNVAATAHLEPMSWSVAFQSRFGRGAWISPYTETIVKDLFERGVRRLAVACPAFTIDCLETLEEIGIRLRETWIELGGTELILVPCLNANPEWIRALAEWLRLLTISEQNS